jgi:isocitrate/isopropylmalate dehydrogenase
LTRQYSIAVLPGDGIGPEVTKEAVKVLESADLNLEYIEANVGGRAYVEKGDPLPLEAKKACDEADAVLFGAVEHHYAPYGVPRKVMIFLRMEKDAYGDDMGVDKRVITKLRAQQINIFAYDYAAENNRKKITCIDKSTWLYADRMFRSSFDNVSKLFPDIEREHMIIDLASMMQVQNPSSFDVVVTPDIYGDILSGIVIGQIGGLL